MKHAACLVVSAVIVLGGGVAFGQECENLNVILKVESTDLNPVDYQYLADYFGVTSFEYCWSQEVIGTLRGTWVLCGTSALFMNDPLGLGIGPELWGNPGVLHTPDGDLYSMSYGLSIWDGDVFVAFGGLTRYVGGTGAFAGGTGWSTDSPKKYPPTYWIQSNGFLCVPE